MTKQSNLLNPFVGLRPYQSDDSLFYFGRTEQTKTLLRLLYQHRFVAVVGSSGSGKSSLIRAGLIPQLEAGFLVQERDQWLIATTKPGDVPIQNLVSSLLALIDTEGTQESFVQRSEALTADIEENGTHVLFKTLEKQLANSDGNLFILVDQFEELFRFSMESGETAKRQQAEQFVALLLSLSRYDLPIYICLTMRSDFLGDCDVFYGLPESINKSQFLVPRLTRSQRQEVITNPVNLAGARIAPRLVDKLLNENTETRDDLPILQHALMRTWDVWQESGTNNPLDIENYEKAHTIHHALDKHADEALGELTPKQQQIAKVLFQALTTIDASNRRIRRPAHIDEVAAIADVEPQEVLSVINSFREQNRSFLILSSTTIEGNPLIDISHESLIRQWKKLDQWVEEESESAEHYQRLVATWLRYKDKKTDLLQSVELEQAKKWQQNLAESNAPEVWVRRYNDDLTNGNIFSEVNEFIRLSDIAHTKALDEEKAEQERQARLFQEKAELEEQKRILAEQKEQEQRKALIKSRWISGIMTLLAVIMLGALWIAYMQQKQAETAFVKANHNLAKMYEEKADFSFYKEDFRKTWLYALEALKLKIPTGEKHLSDSLLEKISSREIIESLFRKRFTASLPDPDSEIKALSYRHDGKVVVVKDNNVVYLLEPGSKTPVSSKDSTQPISQVAFSRDGGLIALVLEDNSIEVRDTNSWEQKALIPPETDESNIRALVFNHDSSLLASGTGYTVNLWDISTAKATKATTPFSSASLIKSLAFNNDSSVIAIGLYSRRFEIGAMHSLVEYGYAPTLEFWNTQTETYIDMTGFGLSSSVENVLYSPDGRQLIVSTQTDEGEPPSADVYILDVYANLLEQKNLINDEKGYIGNITFSPDSELVAIGLSHSKVSIFNTRSGDEEISFNNETGDVSLAYSFQGNHIASSGKEGGVTFWDILFGNRVKTIATDDKVEVRSSDGSLVAMVVDNDVLVDNTKTGEIRKIFEGRYSSVSAVAISPSGNEVAYAIEDNKLFLWDTRTTLTTEINDFMDLSVGWNEYYNNLSGENGNPRLANPPSGSIESLRYSPDGYVLAAGTSNHTIQIWNAKNSADRDFGLPNYGSELKGHTGYVEKLVYNKDGTLLASSSSDDTIYIWNIFSEKRADTFVSGSKKQIIQCESVEQLYFDDAGKLHATGITDGFEKSCMPTTLFNEFDPNIVLKALEVIWDIPSDEGHQTCGVHYGIDNCPLLTEPKGEDSKFDQLIRWLERSCAYKDKHLKADCQIAVAE